MTEAESPAGSQPTTRRSFAPSGFDLSSDALDALPPLLEGVPHEPHPPELADDVEPWHVRLEVALDARDVHAALGRTKDE